MYDNFFPVEVIIPCDVCVVAGVPLHLEESITITADYETAQTAIFTCADHLGTKVAICKGLVSYDNGFGRLYYECDTSIVVEWDATGPHFCINCD